MIKLQGSDGALRQALNLKNYAPEQHRKEIENLAEAYNHTIRFVAQRMDETCAPYAFQLTDDRIYRAVAGILDIFAGKKFMAWVIENHLQEIDDESPGCLVCYFSSSGWEHIGVITAPNRVTSKWGTYPLYEHGLAEVSDEYGDYLRFFVRPSSADSITLFIEFAHECGLSDDDIAEARRRWPS